MIAWLSKEQRWPRREKLWQTEAISVLTMHFYGPLASGDGITHGAIEKIPYFEVEDYRNFFFTALSISPTHISRLVVTDR